MSKLLLDRTGVHACGAHNDENATGADFDSAIAVSPYPRYCESVPLFSHQVI
jgi:hypothetical protein